MKGILGKNCNVMYCLFSRYEEINKSSMDPPRTQQTTKLDTHNLDGPGLPCRRKQKQTVSQNQNVIAIPGLSNHKDGMVFDTDSSYGYVFNSATKNNAPTIGSCKSMITMGEVHTFHTM